MITNRQKAIVDEFSSIQSWEDRYKKIIEMGKALAPLADELKTEDLKVKGCQSQVWIYARLGEDKKVIFQADSDAMIVRGLVALLLKIYSNATPDEILNTQPDFIKALGFESNLSPSRANGLVAMIKQMKYYAAAFKALAQSSS